jgi:1-deoxy-D-xylulose-5-phosphate synthase
MSESEYDAFGTGHASTSVSAALGMAVAAQAKGEKRKVVAVIGDGALEGGLAFEGLNNAGNQKADLLVILNDNNISIDASVGALKEYLIDITTSRTYNLFKNRMWRILGRNSRVGTRAQVIASQIQSSIKGTVLGHSNLFEALKFRYFGPIDGHDVLRLTRVLDDLKTIPGPKLLHCITVKGKGFPKAEEQQTVFHSPGKFDKCTGELIKPDECSNHPLYQDVFGHTIVELARQNEKIVGITPAMPTGCSLNIMMKEMPDRAFDVGICEQHAVTFSAGLAASGLLPFCNIYSSFMQRAYDQVIHDVAIQGLKVVFCLDRGGLVGSDGATHHGFFDIAFMRNIPGMITAAPMDEVELRNMMYTAQLEKINGPFSIRYPRGTGVICDWQQPFTEIPVGRARLISEGKDIAVLSIGHPGNFVVEAAEQLKDKGISILHYDMRFANPLDKEVLHNVFRSFKKIITVEDGIIKGGFGSAVLEFAADHGYTAAIKRLGIPDYFVEHGTQQELWHECGYDAEGIRKAIEESVSSPQSAVSTPKLAD